MLEALEGSMLLYHPVPLGLGSGEASERLATESFTMWSSKNAAMSQETYNFHRTFGLLGVDEGLLLFIGHTLRGFIFIPKKSSFWFRLK